MLVRDWMTRRPVTVLPTTSILEARRLLERHAIRHLPVVQAQRLVGILSSRDLQGGDDLPVRALSGLRSDLLTGRYRSVDSVMSPTPVVTRPGDTVAGAASTMAELRIGALPVLDGLRLVGILSLVDCVRALVTAVPDSGTPWGPQPPAAPRTAVHR